MSCDILRTCNITKNSPRAQSSHPYSRLGSPKWSLGRTQWIVSIWMPSSALGQPSRTLYSVQMLHVDIFQTITDTLVYLQHLLHKVTKQQNNSETNINNTLATLTAQL